MFNTRKACLYLGSNQLRAICAVIVMGMMMIEPLHATDRLVTGGILRGMDLPGGGLWFRGIPYAAAPVATRRWLAPQPVPPWQGVRDATRPGPPCLQRSYEWNASDAASSSEDCLYLDVRVPSHQTGTHLPVMFWIHGGANRAGSGSGYSESTIVECGVVLVTLQYRLGIFGFMSHPALTAQSADHASGNYGIMDQIAALKWVQQNIAQFGGDPDNVTIFGQSAGAQDVGILMLSPRARGLFHKAIAQSGTADFGLPPRSLVENEKLGTDLAEHLGINTGIVGLGALKAVDGHALLDAVDKLVPPIADASFIWDQAVVDGYVLPQSPASLLAAGKQAAVPLIIGSDARELPLYGGPENIRNTIETFFGPHAEEVLALYGVHEGARSPDDPALGSVETQLATDVMFRCPAVFVAERQQALGIETWHYQFGVAKRGSPDPVWHSSELSFVFDRAPDGIDFASWPPVQAYWTNFAKTGNPNGEGLPFWPGYGEGRHYLDLTSEGPRARQDLRGSFCRLLQKP